MRDAQLAERVGVGPVGHGVHLRVGRVARRHAVRLERQRHGRVARHLVRRHVALDPAREGLVLEQVLLVGSVRVGQLLVDGRREILRDAVELGLRERRRAIFQVLPLLLDLLRELLRRQRLDQDLDPRLIEIVAAAEAVVDAQHRLAIGQQVLPGQVLADDRADDRGTAQAATGQDAGHHLALLVARQVDAQVMHLHGGAVDLGAGHGDLELARQPGEFGVERRPLAQDFRPGARIDHFVGRHARELVGGDVADAVARGLDAVHLDRGELAQDLGRVLELDPVELDVRPRREVPVAAVVLARDHGQHAQLVAAKVAVRNRDAVHVGVALHVQAVLQAQRAELFFAQFARQPATHLVSVLRDAFVDDRLVVLVVLIHAWLHRRSPQKMGDPAWFRTQPK